MSNTKKTPETGLVPTHGGMVTPVVTELQQILSAVGGQGGKLSYNDKSGELKASVVKGGFAYFVEKKYVGMASVQTTTTSPIGNSKKERKQQVVELVKAYPNANQATLGEMAGVSQGTVSTYLREAKEEGLI